MCPVELRRTGLHVTGTPLALDARRRVELSFISHAHADHVARHHRVIGTAATLRLMEHRGVRCGVSLPAPYRHGFQLGELYLELFPSGHVLGGAQLRVTRADGVRVVYTGDLSLDRLLTCEPAPVLEADVLVLESTFGHPRFVFPPRAEVLGQVEAWVRTQLERDVAPILLCYSLGKGQEIIKYLGDRGLDLCAHPTTYAISQLYTQLGVALRVREFDGELRPHEVGVFPPFRRSAALRRVRRKATAVLTGWALEPSAVRRYGADAAFALSDHADHPSLIRYARESGATEILTHHGFAHELAQALRRRGLFARPVGRPTQLELPL